MLPRRTSIFSRALVPHRVSSPPARPAARREQATGSSKRNSLLLYSYYYVTSTFSRDIVLSYDKGTHFVHTRSTLAKSSDRSAPREVTRLPLLPILKWFLLASKTFSYMLSHPPDPRRVLRRGGSGLFSLNHYFEPEDNGSTRT